MPGQSGICDEVGPPLSRNVLPDEFERRNEVQVLGCNQAEGEHLLVQKGRRLKAA